MATLFYIMSDLSKGIFQKISQIFARLFFVLGVGIAQLFFVHSVSAATLSISPATGNFSTPNTITVSIEVNTSQAINGVEGVLEFPTSKLELVSFSKSRSMMSLWVQEPSFSNSGQTGVLQFSAIKLNPGFVGSRGKVLDLVFRVKDAGVANIIFSSGSVLANDGKGSNLLSSFGSAVYTLTRGATQTISPNNASNPGGSASIPSVPRNQFLPTPQIKYWVQDMAGKDVLFNTSDADPKWSNSPYAKMTWNLPAEVTGVASVLDDSPDTEPPAKNNNITTNNSQVLPFLNEGKHYFHIRFYNLAGAGPTLHFPVFIDLNEPKHFTIDFADAQTNSRGIHSTSNPRPRAIFFTEDNMSGVDRYAYSLNGSDYVDIPLERDNTFILPKLPSETRQDLVVRAFDLAGNSVDASVSLVVEPIVSPVVTYYPHNADTLGTGLVIDGRAAPGSQVEVVLERKEPIVISVKTDDNGIWRMVYAKEMEPGVYSMRARQILDNGAESSFTEPMTIRINLWSGKVLSWFYRFSIYITLFVLFVIAELVTLYYYRRAVRQMREQMARK